MVLAIGFTALATSGRGETQPEIPASTNPGQKPSDEMIQLIIERAWERASRPPHYVYHVPSPDGRWQFALYGNYDGFDDLSWHVFKIDAATDPRTLVIPDDFLHGDGTDHHEWRSKTLFSSFSEAGYHRDDPHLRVVRDRYLVFVRGGLDHGLYDIDAGKVVLNEESPRHAFKNSRNSVSMDVYQDDSESEKMDEWVRRNLHEPIARIMSEH